MTDLLSRYRLSLTWVLIVSYAAYVKWVFEVVGR